MENPASWGPAEKIISAEIRKHDELPEGFCGLSLPARIAQALREAGLLIDTGQMDQLMDQNDELMRKLAGRTPEPGETSDLDDLADYLDEGADEYEAGGAVDLPGRARLVAAQLRKWEPPAL